MKKSDVNFPWDKFSDQPHILKKEDKKLLRKGYGKDYFKLLIVNLIYFPYLLFKFLLLKNKEQKTIDKKYFYGLCVNLDKGSSQFFLVEELGVKSLQIRFFLKDIQNIDKYVEFVNGFGNDKEILLTIIQDRTHIGNDKLLQKNIIIVFTKFKNIVKEFQIGNTINRIKWEFISMDEYLRFFRTIQKVRDARFPNIKLIGSSVIDFEYHFTIRTLFNNYNIRYDKLASLLYVDRRGSPQNRQYYIFNLKRKIEFLYTIVKNSKKCKNSIYITETNWPLSGTAPYAPTSEKECVDEKTYTRYMKEYFDIALKTGKIEKVFWHQLIASGYGLVDNRWDKIRRTEAFYEFKKIVNLKSI